MGAPQRFPYGSALGFQNQFNWTVGPTVSGTAGNISGTATPNVTLGNLFYLNNTGSVTITNLLLDDTANRLTQYEGKVVRIFTLDTGSTTFANAGALFLNGTNNLLGQNNSIELMFSRGSWFELDRSYVNRSEVSAMVTNAQSSLNMDNVRVAVLNNTGATTNKIIGLSGGQVGQEVTFMNVGSNVIILIGQAGGATSSNMVFLGTNALLIDGSGSYKFVKHTDLVWRGAVANTAT